MTALLAKQTATMEDAWIRLGRIPLNRILFEPAPGTANEEDVVRLHDNENRLVELVDGVLVEKPMGYVESAIASLFIQILREHVERHDLGIVAGEAGMLQLAPSLVRIPDVSIVLWNQLPDRALPTDPIPSLVPDLAVEIVSKSNTPGEIERKVSEYLAAGSQSVWVVYPALRSVSVFSPPDCVVTLTDDQPVEAPAVLPGFSISVNEIFRRAGIR